MAQQTLSAVESEPFFEKAGIPAVPSRKSAPVKWWACLGALTLLIQAYVLTKWFTSGDAKAAPAGPSHMPHWMYVLLTSQEWLNAVVGIGVLYWFVVRKWRQTGHLTLQGMILIIWIQTWLLQDPMENYTNNVFVYNAHFVNLGSWAEQIPGWVAPRSNLIAEPLLFVFGAYAAGMFGGTLLGSWVLGKFRRRWPTMGLAGLLGLTWVFMCFLLFCLESVWTRTGQYSYAGADRSLSLFAGHYYQYPLYNCFLWGLLWTGTVAVLFFRNERGETFVERGLKGTVDTGGKRRQAIRFLALVGVFNIMYLIFYNVPMNLFALHPGPFPHDVLDRSYLTTGVCGIGTNYACPDPRVPLPTNIGTAHLSPQGTLIAPKGVPIQIPATTSTGK